MIFCLFALHLQWKLKNKPKMKRITILLLIIIGIIQAKAVPVDVEENIEFISAMCRIAGYEEYHSDVVGGYASSIDSLLLPYRGSKAVSMLRNVRGKQGVGYDAVATLAANTTIRDGHIILLNGADVSKLDNRWHSGQDAEVVSLMDDVYRSSHFHEFYLSQRPLYDKVVANAQNMVSKVDFAWLSDFFGVELSGRIAVSLLNVGNYGTTCRSAEQHESSVIIVGCCELDASGVPKFYDMESLIVHEFSHPVCNPIIEKNMPLFNGNAALIAQLFETELAEQAYASGFTVLCESMVRAVEMQYAIAHASCAEDTADMDSSIKRMVARGFMPLPEIMEVMNTYKLNRARFANLSEMSSQLVAAINNMNVTQKYCEIRRGQPRIIGTSIPDGATGIKASDKLEIKVFFDKPIINGGFTGNYYNGNESIFPDIRGVKINDDKRILSVYVKTEPNKEYGFVLPGWVYMTSAGYPGLGQAPIHFFTAE